MGRNISLVSKNKHKAYKFDIPRRIEPKALATYDFRLCKDPKSKNSDAKQDMLCLSQMRDQEFFVDIVDTKFASEQVSKLN